MLLARFGLLGQRLEMILGRRERTTLKDWDHNNGTKEEEGEEEIEWQKQHTSKCGLRLR